jgi:hypothetical protein
MQRLKDIVARGMSYNSLGTRDYLEWSEKMLNDYGMEIKPFIKDIRRWSVAIPLSTEDDRMPKINCWQFMGCGLQMKGNLLTFRKPYVCPVLSEKKFDGIHGGKNAGRACWMISHTICNGTRQDSLELKYKTCTICDFYRLVMEDEENNFIGLDALKKML